MTSALAKGDYSVLDVDIIRGVLDGGWDVNKEMTELGERLLHSTSMGGSPKAVQLVVEHGAPIHGRYAGNTYPCPLGDSWWWSPGFGRDDCPEGGFFRRPARR